MITEAPYCHVKFVIANLSNFHKQGDTHIFTIDRLHIYVLYTYISSTNRYIQQGICQQNTGNFLLQLMKF